VTGAERRRTAQRIREAQQRAEQSATAPPVDDPQVPASRLSGYVRTEPVRSTVDLWPTKHAGLAAWTDEASVELGLPPGRRGVTRQVVLAKLVDRLLTDETWARQLRADLAEHYRRQ
jgi:hypothetical protein